MSERRETVVRLRRNGNEWRWTVEEETWSYSGTCHGSRAEAIEYVNTKIETGKPVRVICEEG